MNLRGGKNVTIECVKPEISDYSFLRLFSATIILQDQNPIIDNHQLEKELFEYYNKEEYHFLFEDFKKKEDKIITDGNYIELNEVFQQGYAFGLLLMLRDNHHIKSIINITKEDAKEILSTFDVEQVNAMSNLCNELSNKNNSLKNMKKEYK